MTSKLTTFLTALAFACGAGNAFADGAARNDRIPGSPCSDKPLAPAWLDRMQLKLYRTTCLAAARFDGLFGNDRFDADYQSIHGRLSAGTILNERDQLSAVSRFRVHANLPQMNRRLHVVIGQDDPDDPIVTESRDPLTLRHTFGLEQDDDVLIGLGYRQPAVGGGRFDTSLGAKLGSGFEPYVRGRYRIALPFLERHVVRLSETVFWQERLGVGGTSRVEIDRLITDRLLARWTGSATLATHTQGVRWFSSATVFQSLGDGRALAWQLAASGESRDDVPVSDYGLQIIFRRRVLRDWMFIEWSSGVAWPRRAPAQDRDRDLAAGLSLEMWFGERDSR